MKKGIKNRDSTSECFSALLTFKLDFKVAVSYLLSNKCKSSFH